MFVPRRSVFQELVMACIRSISFCMIEKSSFIESNTVMMERNEFLCVKRGELKDLTCLSISTSFMASFY